MRRPNSISLLAGLVALVGATAPSIALEKGDPAPSLHLSAWVKGNAIDVTEGEGKTIYVIQFFSTAYAPCRAAVVPFSKLQREYKDRGVVCLGVSDEQSGTVRRYVRNNKDQFEFRVAADPGRRAFRAYMDATGVRGLPYAFIIDANGRIAWHGHPLDDMEETLEKVVAARDGDAKADAHANMSNDDAAEIRLLEGFSRAYATEDWEEALRQINGLLELNPDDPKYIMAKLHLLLAQLGDVEQTNEWGMAMVQTHAENANLLNELAWRLLTHNEYSSRCMKPAYAAAVAANKACDAGRSDIADTLARALYQVGRLDEAIREQERAVKLAQGQSPEVNPAVLQEMQEVLRYYRDCAAARDTVN